MVDDPEKRCKFKMGLITQFFNFNNDVIRSTRVKMAHDELSRPVVKFAAKFFEEVSAIKTSLALFAPLLNNGKSHQTELNNFEAEKAYILFKKKWKKLKSSKLKHFICWD